MGELARLFPTEIAADPRWPTTLSQGPQGQAKLRKFAVVKVLIPRPNPNPNHNPAHTPTLTTQTSTPSLPAPLTAAPNAYPYP